MPFKATAGLHHRAARQFSLTYADDSPRAAMHGFSTCSRVGPRRAFVAEAAPSRRAERRASLALARRSASGRVRLASETGRAGGGGAYTLAPLAIAARQAFARTSGRARSTSRSATCELALIDDQAQSLMAYLHYAQRHPQSDALSWIDVGQRADGDFPIQNLPFGVFQREASDEPRIGVAIGDLVLDVAAAAERRLLTGSACRGRGVRRALAERADGARAGRAGRRCARASASLLRDGTRRCAATQPVEPCILPMASGTLLVSRGHRRLHGFLRVGPPRDERRPMLRPDQPLLPNYKYVPIGYHGRASSIVVSGTWHPASDRTDAARRREPPLVRAVEAPRLRARSRVLHRSRQSASARRSCFDQAERHLFGVCLLNDWSARDVQAVGVSAARTVPREELCDEHLAVDGDHGSARALSCAPASSARPGDPGSRCRT